MQKSLGEALYYSGLAVTILKRILPTQTALTLAIRISDWPAEMDPPSYHTTTEYR